MGQYPEQCALYDTRDFMRQACFRKHTARCSGGPSGAPTLEGDRCKDRAVVGCVAYILPGQDIQG